jgi:metal-dependent amidase/aminoacylase/carboxypeptidase family protein
MSITDDRVLSGLDAITSGLEDLYRDIHAHPELSLQERRTAGLAADRLRRAGYDVTEQVGGTWSGCCATETAPR